MNANHEGHGPAPRCGAPSPDVPDGAAPAVCVLPPCHTGPHGDGTGRLWAPRLESDHDPLETAVSVAGDRRTVSLWVDGYEVPLSCDPGVAEAHVDLLRRIQAACDQAVRLIRSPQARRAFAEGPGADLPWLTEDEAGPRWWPPPGHSW